MKKNIHPSFYILCHNKHEYNKIRIKKLTAKIHQYNIRSNLFDITKRDFVLISEEKAPNPTLFRYNQFPNAAIAFIKFQIHDMPKLTAVLHTDNFLFAKFIECHKTTIKHRITIGYAIRRIM